MKKIFHFCNPYLKKQSGKLCLYILISLLLGLTSFVSPYVTGHFIDDLIGKSGSSNTWIWHYIALLLGVGCITFVAGYLKERLYNLIQMRCALAINIDAVRHVQNVSTKRPKDTAFLNQQINGDSNFITMFCMNTLQNIVVNSVTIIVPLLVVFSMEPLLASLLVGLDVIYLLVYQLLKRAMYRASMELLNSQSDFFSRLNEQLFNVRFIQLQGIAKSFIARLDFAAEAVLKKVLKSQNVEYGFQGTDTLVVMGATCLSFVIGGRATINGQITVGEFSIILSFFTMSMSATRFFFNLGQDVQEIAASCERLEQVFAEKEQPNGDQSISSIEQLSCKNLTFAYGEKPIVRDQTITFEKGKCYALVGENGAGKSTLIDLLLGIYVGEYQGEITYNGISVEKLDMRVIRKNMVGISEQEPLLLPETLEFNLTLDDKATILESDFQKYCQILGLETFIHSLKDGLQTMINEKSSNLSGGEKQKLSIMRALLKRPEILVLDEPTSAMDKESSMKFAEFLREYGKNRIVIISTHDKELMNCCDEIVTIRKEK